MRPFPFRHLLIAAVALLAWPSAAHAVRHFVVPTIATPTVKAAVMAAAAVGAGDEMNYVELHESPIYVGETVDVDGMKFGLNRQLVIRPDPTVPGLKRVALISQSASDLLFNMHGAAGEGHAVLQDLDLLRGITNLGGLILVAAFGNATFERCRIGSISTPGTTGHIAMIVSYPYYVVVRNCVFFAQYPGTFDKDLQLESCGDPANSFFVYNNVFADYGVAGLELNDGLMGSLLVVRNNVLSNSPSIPAGNDPFALMSNVVDGVHVRSSHNAVLVSAGHTEVIAGAQSVQGTDLVTLPREEVVPSFVNYEWGSPPPGAYNTNFFRLVWNGPLHDPSSRLGVTVLNGSPDVEDLAVTDDIEGDPRPSGPGVGHTDRGADQLEVMTAAVAPPPERGLLWATPLQNPARTLALAFGANAAGRVILEVFDPAGRLLHHAERAVSARETGELRWAGAEGLVICRVQLLAGSRRVGETVVKVAVLR